MVLLIILLNAIVEFCKHEKTFTVQPDKCLKALRNIRSLFSWKKNQVYGRGQGKQGLSTGKPPKQKSIFIFSPLWMIAKGITVRGKYIVVKVAKEVERRYNLVRDSRQGKNPPHPTHP